jgi:hypothetical protein
MKQIEIADLDRNLQNELDRYLIEHPEFIEAVAESRLNIYRIDRGSDSVIGGDVKETIILETPACENQDGHLPRCLCLIVNRASNTWESVWDRWYSGRAPDSSSTPESDSVDVEVCVDCEDGTH